MISYGKQSIDGCDIEAVIDALKSDFLTTGPSLEAFETELARLTGARYAVACSNGTTALHLACLAIGVQKGDIGLTSPITFVASANCVEMCSGRVDFIDVGDGISLDPNRLEDYCKRHPAPKVAIPVDFAGPTARLEEIHSLGQRYGFTIIEDASHSLGSTYITGGKSFSAGACVHSDLATLSFHPVKNITTGEGGAVLTNDKSLADRLRLFRSHGIERDPTRMSECDGGWDYEMVELGFNYRITDIQCALGLSQLRKLAAFKKRRQEIVDLYNQAFALISEIQIPEWPEAQSPCFHLYPIVFRDGPHQRRFVYDHLKKRNIFAQVHYIPVHLQPYYQHRYGYSWGDFPRSEAFYNGALSLPLHVSITNEDVATVIAAVREALQEYEK